MSQPSTPFGCGKNFTYNASATSSPYSFNATPVPSEWNDFSSHANNGIEAFTLYTFIFHCYLFYLKTFKGDTGTEGFPQLDPAQQEFENFHEIISEVYANNHQELAPCLDGLDAEASASFSQMNFQGTNTGEL